MNSLRSHLFLLLLKYRHVFRGKLRRPVVDRTTSIAALRARADKSSARFGSLPRGIEVAPVSIDGIAAEWVRPPVDGARVILYFHGGGYVMGSRVSHRPAVANFVAGSGLAALVFDYRLAPEHPFPAALEDALAAYSWLLARETSDDIVFLGDSAGGGLALATLLALRDRGMPLPAAAAVMSPWTDLTCTGETYRRPDPLAPAGSWHVFAHHYCAGQDPRNPMISPLYGDQRGLPPLLIHVGERESMLSDSTRLAEKAREAGVRVRLHVGRGMVHCYPVFSPKFPEARKAMDDICEFLRTGR